MKNAAVKARAKGIRIWCRAKAVLRDQVGENYVDVGVKILIVALLLAGLYTRFGDVVMPTLTRKITEMFNYGS